MVRKHTPYYSVLLNLLRVVLWCNMWFFLKSVWDMLGKDDVLLGNLFIGFRLLRQCGPPFCFPVDLLHAGFQNSTAIQVELCS